MQIHYLWINNSYYLKDAGINLSSRFIFEMELLNSSQANQTRTLIIYENPDYIPDFFEKKNIKNVTAIIGKNGAGKSSILKYIRHHLPDGISANFHEDVIAYEMEEENEILFYLLIPDHLGLAINDKTELFTIQRFGDIPIESLRFSGIPSADYIHYSYFLEYNEDMNNYSGLINISTTAYLEAARTRIIEENLGNKNVQSQLLAKTSDLQNLYLDEVARAIQFLGAEDSRRLPFERPTELTVEINLDDSIYFEDNKKHLEINDLLEELYRRNISKRKEDRLINNLLLAIFINFQIDEKKYSINNPSKYQIPLNETESAFEYITRFFEEMKGYQVRIENDEVRITRYDLLSSIIPEFIEFMEDLIKRKIIKVTLGEGTQFNLPLTEETEEIFQRLRDYYLKVKGVSTFFNFRWRSLSTGEQSYLSFMSRFYHIKHHEHHKLQKNLVIMIDEGDACYHPEWQRQFFNLTLNYLSALFSEHTIQLIFTANTPFLSSDLPKSNVLFLEKTGKRTSLYHSKENNRIQTFAANIHTLYSNSFYMDGILIGAFAKNKLDKIIKYLNDKKVTSRNEDYLKTIRLIGEPVLRRKLLDMWAEKFGLNEERLRLQERLDEIDKLIKENNKGTQND
ncbi:ATP-binding protein [Chryseobacterium sp. ERMR1:04]|uniref:ATP-binding protein n=1 Tax=Chryseobacterium sp. ERMR1:04 TaxID=1705393 RepID=UPI0011876D37|nr:ATP-binding protein [Chryseobacterium sp. ERMR1:04]